MGVVCHSCWVFQTDFYGTWNITNRVRVPGTLAEHLSFRILSGRNGQLGWHSLACSLPRTINRVCGCTETRWTEKKLGESFLILFALDPTRKLVKVFWKLGAKHPLEWLFPPRLILWFLHPSLSFKGKPYGPFKTGGRFPFSKCVFPQEPRCMMMFHMSHLWKTQLSNWPQRFSWVIPSYAWTPTKSAIQLEKRNFFLAPSRGYSAKKATSKGAHTTFKKSVVCLIRIGSAALRCCFVVGFRPVLKSVSRSMSGTRCLWKSLGLLVFQNGEENKQHKGWMYETDFPSHSLTWNKRPKEITMEPKTCPNLGFSLKNFVFPYWNQLTF